MIKRTDIIHLKRSVYCRLFHIDRYLSVIFFTIFDKLIKSHYDLTFCRACLSLFS